MTPQTDALLSAMAQAAAPDTVVTYLARDGLRTAADVSLVILGAFLVVLILLLLLLLRQLRKLDRTVRTLGDRALDKADPLVEKGKGVAENVEFISAAVRTDVERLNKTVKSLTERLHQASDRMEERIEEFNALMEVVQGEAEEIFIGTASAARGMKEGVRTLGGPRAPEPNDDSPTAHEEE